MFEENKSMGMGGLVLTALFVGIAIMMNVFACVLLPEKNFNPLIILFAQMMVPLPLILCGTPRSSYDSIDGEMPFISVLGWFMSGIFASMALFVPLTMLHEDSISGKQLGLTYGAQALMYVIFAVAAKKLKSD